MKRGGCREASLRNCSELRADCEREWVAAGRKAGSVMTWPALLVVVAPDLSRGQDPEASLLHLSRLSSVTVHVPFVICVVTQRLVLREPRLWSGA